MPLTILRRQEHSALVNTILLVKRQFNPAYRRAVCSLTVLPSFVTAAFCYYFDHSLVLSLFCDSVEMRGLEPLTFALQRRCSPN